MPSRLSPKVWALWAVGLFLGPWVPGWPRGQRGESHSNVKWWEKPMTSLHVLCAPCVSCVSIMPRPILSPKGSQALELGHLWATCGFQAGLVCLVCLLRSRYCDSGDYHRLVSILAPVQQVNGVTLLATSRGVHLLRSVAPGV